MRIYLAGPWTHRFQANGVAKQIRAAGHIVTSRWHDLWLESDSDDPTVLETEAQNDLLDLDHSDQLIVLNIEKSEGKAVEQGYALALGIPIIIVGDARARFNIFQYLDAMTLVPDISAALNLLS